MISYLEVVVREVEPAQDLVKKKKSMKVGKLLTEAQGWLWDLAKISVEQVIQNGVEVTMG